MGSHKKRRLEGQIRKEVMAETQVRVIGFLAFIMEESVMKKRNA